MRQPILGPLDGDWSAWGSPLDRKRDTLAWVRQVRGLPVDGPSIRAMDMATVDKALATVGVTVWTPGGFGHVGGCGLTRSSGRSTDSIHAQRP